MKAKEKLQRFLGIFLACIMILNTPMSVLANNVQVWNMAENVQFTAEKSASSESMIFSDEGFVGESGNQFSENPSENVTDANLFAGENPDTIDVFSAGEETEPTLTVTSGGEVVEVQATNNASWNFISVSSDKDLTVIYTGGTTAKVEGANGQLSYTAEGNSVTIKAADLATGA